MTHTQTNIRSSYILACALALASPIIMSIVPALIAAVMVVVLAVLFARAHGLMLGGLALLSLTLSAFGILLTIHPAILSTYLG